VQALYDDLAQARADAETREQEAKGSGSGQRAAGSKLMRYHRRRANFVRAYAAAFSTMAALAIALAILKTLKSPTNYKGREQMSDRCACKPLLFNSEASLDRACIHTSTRLRNAK
jgi:hypothetical protein